MLSIRAPHFLISKTELFTQLPEDLQHLRTSVVQCCLQYLSMTINKEKTLQQTSYTNFIFAES